MHALKKKIKKQKTAFLFTEVERGQEEKPCGASGTFTGFLSGQHHFPFLSGRMPSAQQVLGKAEISSSALESKAKGTHQLLVWFSLLLVV